MHQDAIADYITDDLKKLLGGDKDVEEVKEKGLASQYKKVFDAVKQAGNGEVKVFKVQIDGTRAEFYVVSVDEKEGKIVGLKALSVES
jgi:predicted aspartyl protease